MTGGTFAVQVRCIVGRAVSGSAYGMAGATVLLFIGDSLLDKGIRALMAGIAVIQVSGGISAGTVFIYQ